MAQINNRPQFLTFSEDPGQATMQIPSQPISHKNQDDVKSPHAANTLIDYFDIKSTFDKRPDTQGKNMNGIAINQRK